MLGYPFQQVAFIDDVCVIHPKASLQHPDKISMYKHGQSPGWEEYAQFTRSACCLTWLVPFASFLCGIALRQLVGWWSHTMGTAATLLSWWARLGGSCTVYYICMLPDLRFNQAWLMPFFALMFGIAEGQQVGL